jgi:hypothetical protein
MQIHSHIDCLSPTRKVRPFLSLEALATPLIPFRFYAMSCDRAVIYDVAIVARWTDIQLRPFE